MKCSITLRQYCYLSILLPIILPLIAMTPKFFWGYDCPSPASMFCILSMVFGVTIVGLPTYIVLVLLFLYKARRMTTDQMVQHSYFAPLYFMLIGLVVFPLNFFIMTGEIVALDKAIGFYLILFIPSLIYGYFYVWLAHLLGWILTECGMIVADDAKITKS